MEQALRNVKKTLRYSVSPFGDGFSGSNQATGLGQILARAAHGIGDERCRSMG